MPAGRPSAVLAVCRASSPSVRAIDLHWQAALLPELVQLPALRQRLVASPRLERRLARLLGRRAGLRPLPAATIAPDMLHLAGLDPAGIRDIAHLVGGIWHGASLAKLVLREEVGAIHSAIGAPVHEEIYRWRDRWVAPSAVATPEVMLERIARHGWQAIGAWLLQAPAPIAKRVLLRLDPELLAKPPLDPAEGPVAVVLVRDVARRAFARAAGGRVGR